MKDSSRLAYHEEPIAKHHHRDKFDCGEDTLNEFLRRYARKNHEMGASKTFLAISDSDNQTVLGFYSLSPASVSYIRTPELIRRGLARYEIPAFRLARLGVDRSVQGRGVGGQLLLAAGRRCLNVAAEVGGIALLIDAKNERVAQWYEKYGAVPLLDAPLTLMLPLQTIQSAIRSKGRGHELT